MSIVRLRPELLSGGVSFSNRALRLTAGMEQLENGPLWQLKPHPVRLDGREPDTVHATFSSIADSHDGSPGWISENEHGLTADFHFNPPYFDLLQQAALSAADLEISVLSGARNGQVETLMLSIEHKTA